jgi:hypothetical protein
MQAAMAVMLWRGSLAAPSCGMAVLASVPLVATLVTAGGVLVGTAAVRTPIRLGAAVWLGLQPLVVAFTVGSVALSHQLTAAVFYALVQGAAMIVVVAALGKETAKRHFGR